MSRVVRQAAPDMVASLGGFVMRRGEGGFRARPNVAPEPGNDFEAGPVSLEQAEADAYAQGYADARRTVELELAAERDAIAQLAGALEVLRPEPTNALALLLAEAVDRLVRQVVGEVDIDGITLLARAKAAAELVGAEVRPARLRAHPDDEALLNGADIDVEIIADATLERGAIILETGHGWIEDGPAVRLERLRAELDRMAAR